MDKPETRPSEVRSDALLADLKARRRCGTAFDQLCNERRIADFLEQSASATDHQRQQRKDET